MFVLVSLKAYPCGPVEVATAARDVAEASDVRIAVSPQAADISCVADTGVETRTQHVDPNGHGSHTGSTLAEAVAEAGVIGTLINHFKKRLKLADINDSVQAAKQAGFETCVCANNPAQIGAISVLSPDSVTVGPPELIGGDVSIVTADPGVAIDAIGAAANMDEDVEVYCGADISTGDDVVAAEELGAPGILLASGVAGADDPRAALKDLVSGL